MTKCLFIFFFIFFNIFVTIYFLVYKCGIKGKLGTFPTQQNLKSLKKSIR